MEISGTLTHVGSPIEFFPAQGPPESRWTIHRRYFIKNPSTVLNFTRGELYFGASDSRPVARIS